jgi:hypothetical protein
MLTRFALLVGLSLADALLTCAEAAHAGVAPAVIEANPIAAAALSFGLPGLLVLKLLPLATFGVLTWRAPRPRALAVMLAVYVAVVFYHGVLRCAA